jgi:HEAT repeat protein
MKTLLGVVAFLGLVVPGLVRGGEVEDLIKQLKAKDPDARRAAAKALAETGADAKPAVAALVGALKDSDLFVRRFAAQALGEIGPDAAKEAVPALGALLKDNKEKKEVQEAATIALGKLKMGSVPALIEVVKDKDKDLALRRKAVEALGAVGAEAKPAIPTLIDALGDLEPPAKGKKPKPFELRNEAAAALGEIATPDDKEVLEALKGAMGVVRGKDNFKKIAGDAIKKIEGKKS